MQTRSTARTGAGALLMGATKADIRNAAATTSRCVGSDKSGQPELRPARDHFVHESFCCGANAFRAGITYIDRLNGRSTKRRLIFIAPISLLETSRSGRRGNAS